jgi:hypothetical protein
VPWSESTPKSICSFFFDVIFDLFRGFQYAIPSPYPAKPGSRFYLKSFASQGDDDFFLETDSDKSFSPASYYIDHGPYTYILPGQAIPGKKPD